MNWALRTKVDKQLYVTFTHTIKHKGKNIRSFIRIPKLLFRIEAQKKSKEKNEKTYTRNAAVSTDTRTSTVAAGV